MKPTITVETLVKSTIEDVWEKWNGMEHMKGWSFASDDWEATGMENDLRVGGRFKTIMAAKDKSTQFDFEGTYTAVIEGELLEYNLDDGRHVKVEFVTSPDDVNIIETFDPENENSEELQRNGWKAILDNFKKYVEGNSDVKDHSPSLA